MRFHVPSLALAGALALGAAAGLPARADDTKPAAPAAPETPKGDAQKTPEAPKAPEVTPASATPPCEPGKADSARRCVESLYAYAEKQDFEKALSFMAEPFRSVLASGKALNDSEDHLKKAMETKFGPGAADALGLGRKKPATSFLQGNFGVLDVKEEADKTVVIAREVAGTRTEVFDCKKAADGFWLASIPPRGPRPADLTPEKEAQMAAAMVTALKDGSSQIEQIAADVDAGKLATKEEVRPKYDRVKGQLGAAMMAAMASAMGGGPKPQPKQPEAPKHDEPKKDEPKKEGQGN